MATYNTDLVDINTADTATDWGEFGTPYALGGTPDVDEENFIQGVDCVSQTTGTKSGLTLSICYDAGSDISGSFSAGDCVFMWQFYAVGANLETYANGGFRLGIGASTTTIDSYAVGGSNFGRNPYGGWQNVVVDPTIAGDYTDGGGNGGAWQYFGSIPYTLAAISKGTPHAVDAIRRGRGEIYCTGTDCTFIGMAQENDYNDVTNGYNRWGLFQDVGGTYLWKGLMSFGQAGTSATFSDSNKTIIIDDTAKVYAGFNKIEVNNASTSVTLTNISFISLSTVSAGQFEMVDNATVVMAGCAFLDMSSFIWDSNATLTSCIFNGCGQITHGGADFDSCNFEGYEGTADTGYITYNEAVDPDGELDNCSFTKGTASTHAIQFGTASAKTMTLRGIAFSGYNASDGQTDSTLLMADTGSDITWTVNAVGCTGNISYKKARATDTVNIVIDPVATTITVKDVTDLSLIQNARVLLEAKDATGSLDYQVSVSITRSGTVATVTHTDHGKETDDWVHINGCTQDEYNIVAQITYIGVSSYSYTVPDTPATPATGSPTCTDVIFNNLTNASGIVTDSRSYTADQPVIGRARRSTISPLYKNQPISETIDKDIGLSINVLLIPDE